jgi:two-component system sensor histidine kinase PilS (NtrC family)
LIDNKTTSDISNKLSWLMLARVIFALLILASTIYVHLQVKETSEAHLLIIFYYLVAFIFTLSLFYAIISRRVTRHVLFSYIQFAVDTMIVTLIVYITGGYYSFFSFLYLVVIIYASMILYLKGGLFVASFGSALHAILLLFELSAVLPSIGGITETGVQGLNWTTVTYKILIITAACFAVAFLSGLLTEQNRKSQNELRTMEDHLKRVEKMAYMGEMAAGLAHEIKNPLASLAGSIQLLKEDLRYAPDHERLMEIILRETDRLNILVSDFLFFSKPPAGKPEKVELKRAICEVTELFERDSINAQKIRLDNSISKDFWVLIDPSHLRQIIWNLLLNAADAIGENGEIVIDCEAIKNKVVAIKVSDNGCGMEPDVARSIFDPFFTTKSNGTGLGLSIIHRILESYNSRLEVHSVPAMGTTFTFQLEIVKPTV